MKGKFLASNLKKNVDCHMAFTGSFIFIHLLKKKNPPHVYYTSTSTQHTGLNVAWSPILAVGTKGCVPMVTKGSTVI